MSARKEHRTILRPPRVEYRHVPTLDVEIRMHRIYKLILAAARRS